MSSPCVKSHLDRDGAKHLGLFTIVIDTFTSDHTRLTDQCRCKDILVISDYYICLCVEPSVLSYHLAPLSFHNNSILHTIQKFDDRDYNSLSYMYLSTSQTQLILLFKPRIHVNSVFCRLQMVSYCCM